MFLLLKSNHKTKASSFGFYFYECSVLTGVDGIEHWETEHWQLYLNEISVVISNLTFISTLTQHPAEFLRCTHSKRHVSISNRKPDIYVCEEGVKRTLMFLLLLPGRFWFTFIQSVSHVTLCMGDRKWENKGLLQWFILSLVPEIIKKKLVRRSNLQCDDLTTSSHEEVWKEKAAQKEEKTELQK